jgi:hypothetical protein
MAKSRKMTYQDTPNPGLWQAWTSKEDLMKPAAYCKAIGKSPPFAPIPFLYIINGRRSQKNYNCILVSRIQPSRATIHYVLRQKSRRYQEPFIYLLFRDERFWLVVQAGIFKLTFHHFDKTKQSQESLSRTKWFYVPLVRLYYSIKT